MSRPTAHFRGWFLVVVVLGWLGGWALTWWRGLPGVVALVGVVALLLVADARGVFTLRGRLPWGSTGVLGRILLGALVVALLPLVVTLYLLASTRRFAGARRLRVASIPVALAEPPAEEAHLAGGTSEEKAPATRPLPSALPPLSQLTATAHPGAHAPGWKPMDAERLEAAPEELEYAPTYADTYASDDGPGYAAQPTTTSRRRGRLLVGALVAGAAVLLVSCGLLAYAGPARGLMTHLAASGGRQTPALAGATGDAGAANPGVMSTTTPMTPTPSVTATATVAPTATATPPPATPTPAHHGSAHHARPATPPPAPPAIPTAPSIAGADNGGQPSAANPFGLGGPLQVVFTCAPDQLAAFDHICFYAPMGSQVEVEVSARCVAPYTATLNARQAVTPDGTGALAWRWRPSRECQAGRVRVALRITQDGFTYEVPVREFSVG
jgi:hypothetical protein